MVIRATLLMLACCCVLAGQSTETYTSFLLQVARLGNGGNAVLLNGEPVAKDFQSKMATMDLALRSAT